MHGALYWYHIGTKVILLVIKLGITHALTIFKQRHTRIGMERFASNLILDKTTYGEDMKATMGITLLTTTLLSTGAFALTKNIKIDLDSAHMKGQSRIPLTKMIRQEAMGPVKGWKLSSVILSAKSKQGGAQAVLKIGRSESLPKDIAGTPEAFDSDYSGYSSITLNAPYSYRGEVNLRAKILIQGNVKAQSLKVKMKKQVNYDYTNDVHAVYETAGTFKADKIIGSSKTYNINGKLDSIKLTSAKGKVSVTKVVVVFKNGEKIEVEELDGKLKSGQAAKVFTLKNALKKPVKKIIVSAVSTKMFGSRGALKVELAK